jgi:4-amino-4-deoxy-L-arabinose transferase-like glycosyltransferase
MTYKLLTIIKMLTNLSFSKLIIISIFITLSWSLLLNTPLTYDAHMYNANALSISQGNGYDPNVSWPVGYSLFLSSIYTAVGYSLFAARIANAILYVGIVAGTFYLTKTWFKSRQQAIVAALMLLTYPGFLVFISLTMSEILFTFLLLMGLTCLQVARSLALEKKAVLIYLVSGGLFGAATLVRPQVIFVPFIVIVIFFISSHFKRLKYVMFPVVIVYFGIVLILTPWMYHTYTLFDEFVFVSTNGGVNLFIGNNPRADGRNDGSNMPINLETYLGYDLSEATDAVAHDKLYRNAAVDYAMSHPLDTIRLWPAKLFYLFRDEIAGWLFFENGMLKLGGMAVSQVLYMAQMLLFMIGIFLSRKQLRNASMLAPITLILYYVCLSLVFFGESRYKLPIMPFVLMFSSYAFLQICCVADQPGVLEQSDAPLKEGYAHDK